jgi:hypothetical protein
MTRVLIIGSSHVGAYRNAHDAFATLYPELTVDYFAVRGPHFLKGVMDKTGVFVPHLRNDEDRSLTRATNGTDAVDTGDSDHLLMVGHRFAFVSIAGLLDEHDILEGARTERKRLISRAMVKETISSVTQVSVAKAVEAISNYDRPASFAMAPYPASSIIDRGDEYDLARILRKFWSHPDAEWVFETWLEEVDRALEVQDCRLLHQPQSLCAAPFATKSEYANRPTGLGGDILTKTDHRHMNADFGLAMLCEYAENHLGLVSDFGEQTAPTERNT